MSGSLTYSPITHLLGRTLQLLETVLEAVHLGLQLDVLGVEQVLVEGDLLQEGLGGGVVVAPLVGQVGLGHLGHRDVGVGHEAGDGFAHLRLKMSILKGLYKKIWF